MKKAFIITAFALAVLGCKKETIIRSDSKTAVAAEGLDPTAIAMNGELPDKEAIPVLFDEMDYQQATQCYLWGLPLVAFAEWQQQHYKTFGATSNDLVFYNTYQDRLGILTANATTPYIMSFIDLAANGPTVIDMPAGHTAGGLGDFWQREQAVIGEMGPDKGKGGKYVLVPPTMKDFKAEGYFIVPCATMNMFFGFRALDPDPKITEELVKGVKIYPYANRTNPTPTKVVSPGNKKWFGGQPVGFAYWERLHAILQEEPIEERDRFFAAWLQNMGIAKGKPFNPDARMKGILEKAAKIANAQMRVQSFADRREDRVVWKDRKWEWVGLRPENGDFDTPNYTDLDAREVWFYQAIGASPAMFKRGAGAGSVYWLGTKDASGQYLDGGKNYKLTIPLPVPAKLFWSVTVYDTETRSQVATDLNSAALRSMFELKDLAGAKTIDLYFGPDAPAGKEKQWIKTIPNKGWFTYFRVYGPEAAAFDGSWQPGDFEEVK